jgi:hypothetical protein
MTGDLFAPPAGARRIAHVYLSWQKRKVVTFDQHNEIMVEYTGPWTELREVVLRDKPEGARLHGNLEDME